MAIGYCYKPLIIFLLCVAISSAQINRVMTYNIHHGEGTDSILDIKRIAQVINKWSPELVALQEVDNGTTRSGNINEADTLAMLTEMHSVFGKNIDVFGGGYGNAVLSKYPIIRSENRKLPRVNNGEPRGVLAVWVQLPKTNDTLVFISTHFDHRLDPEERVRSTEQIKSWIVRGDFGDDIILAGDLNDIPSSDIIIVFNSICDGSNQSARYKTFPSDSPDRQIDYIFACRKGRYAIDSFHVIDEPIISDHLPLIGDIIFP